MKKDRMRELLTELRDRDFDLKECCNVFMYVHDWTEARKEMSENDNPNLSEYYQRQFDHYSSELEMLLNAYGLDYTLDEFITYD